MEIFEGTPKKSGWFLNVIPRTGIIDNNPENFIGLWTDYFDLSNKSWLIHSGEDMFWAFMPDEIEPISMGKPSKVGNYLLLLHSDTNNSPWYFPPNISIEKIQSLDKAFQSERVVEGFPSNTILFCEEDDNIFGWTKLPKLVFPGGKTVDY